MGNRALILKNQLKNQSGFSLVQVIIAAGLMAIIAATFAQIVAESSKFQARIERKFDNLQSITLATNVLSDPVNCMTMMGTGRTFDSTNLATQSLAVNHITAPPTNAAIMRAQTSTLTSGTLVQSLIVQQMTSTVDPNKYTGKLWVTPRQTPEQPNDKARFIPLIIETDPDPMIPANAKVITSCRYGTEAIYEPPRAWTCKMSGTGCGNAGCIIVPNVVSSYKLFAVVSGGVAPAAGGDSIYIDLIEGGTTIHTVAISAVDGYHMMGHFSMILPMISTPRSFQVRTRRYNSWLGCHNYQVSLSLMEVK